MGTFAFFNRDRKLFVAESSGGRRSRRRLRRRRLRGGHSKEEASRQRKSEWGFSGGHRSSQGSCGRSRGRVDACSAESHSLDVFLQGRGSGRRRADADDDKPYICDSK